ncbi:MAG: DNA cytosine methyltransferase [Oscillospiraceae bacterium]
MKVLSLFDGISCGMVALERAGITVDRYCAFEIEEKAIQVSKANYPAIEQFGDVIEADFTKFSGFDLLIGGSPCTYWSISKKNREITADGLGFKLFMQYKRALEQSSCKYFLYENNSSIHQEIQYEISDKLGVKPIEINSSLLSAQQRKRLYWTNITNVSIPQDKGITVESIIDGDTEENNLFEVTAFNEKQIKNYSNIPVRIGTIGKGGQAERVYSIKGKSVNLIANGGGRGAKTGLYLINDTVRKLSPLEAERLQTLPDNYTAAVTNGYRYKCIGNGWTVDVIAHIFTALRPHNSQIL